ncbi:DUF418 domain-containing protein [Bacillus aquiflavi]|uniref:DUF418 domain-containing protein n=1 Tax=Bacillus aquiflavi TaxID=2672567 RepID=A0A6B3VY89_9BACI|nr:DUF418 domain-containing protein [Bacillus aquiflavi]MBA4536335.1 DUF418 domain-containing protein [Bacillus aquiflavi]NEY80703.1 DUF418 domain-containing protein [Bacillus aquiflavi]
MSQSVLGKERILSLDIIRGFAIFGIFLVNIPAMTGLDSNLEHAFTGADKTVRFLLDLFVQTKFYTIFSFLFGIGFYIFMSRAEARGDKVYLLFTRRLVILFIFGALHYCLFWDGDILHTYAFIGFFLLIFYKRKPLTIFIWSIILFALYHFSLSYTLFMPDHKLFGQEETIATANYFSGWLAAVSTRTVSFFTDNMINLIIAIPEILSLFLLGLFVGKIDLFRKVAKYKQQFQIIQLISLSLSILFFIPIIMLFFSDKSYISIKNFFWMTISGKTLAIFYVTTILLATESEIGQKILKPFGYVGRMAFTNYLSQTFIGVMMLSLFVKNTASLPLWSLMLIVLFIYALQAFLSKRWLEKYQFGPIEWFWRIGTYGKVQSIRRKVQPS